MSTTETNGRSISTTDAGARTYAATQLRDIRLRRGLTQAQLAEGLGLRAATISAVECASRNVALPTAKDVLDKARAYDAQLPTAPAEVEPEAAGRETLSRARVAAQYRAFVQRNRLSVSQQIQLFGISHGHLYRIRSGRPGVSDAVLQRILATMVSNPDGRITAPLAPRTYRRRTSAAPTPQPTEQAVARPSTPPPPPANVLGNMKAAFVTPETLATAITLDGVTPHYFVNAMGGILVLKPA